MIVFWFTLVYFNTGAATKIDEYVPTTTPIIIANENPFNISPPKIYIANSASKVVVDVMSVLDNVWLVERFEISVIEILEYFFKVSLIRSKITTVSFME